MNNKKLIWLLGAITIVIAFLFFIPNGIYNISPLIFSVLGTGLTLLCIFQSIYNFKNIQEYRDKVEKGNDRKFKILVISSIPLAFIFFMTFWINFAFNKSSEIDQYGVKTHGTIISTKVRNIKRKTGTGKVFYARVKFVTEEGKTIISEEQITEEQHRNINAGQEIELSYSKKDPNIVRINVAEKKELENLKISQLIELLHTRKDSLDIKLRTFNPRLKKVDETNWKDEYNDIVRIEDSTMISAIIRGDLMNKFYLELNHLGFNEVEVESDQELFESENYRTILNKRNDGLLVLTVAIVARK